MTNTELLTEICIQFRRMADLIDEYVSRTETVVNSDEAEGSAFMQGELSDTVNSDGGTGSVGVIVVNNGRILTGIRKGDTGSGLICGPGGHIENGETPEQAAIRETQEEFGITPKELILIGRGPVETDTGLSPHIFLCTEYGSEIKCEDGEIGEPRFLSHLEIDNVRDILFKPFADSVLLFFSSLFVDEINSDGGHSSGNHNHEGVPGQVGGSAPSAKVFNSKISESYKAGDYTKVQSAIRECLRDAPIGTKVTSQGTTYTKVENNKYEYEFIPGKKFTVTENGVANGADCVNPKNAPIFEEIKSEDIAKQKIENGEIKPSETSVKTVISSVKSQSDLASLSDDERKNLISEICSENPNYGLEYNGTAANEIAARLDLNKPPTMLDKRDFERYVSENNCIKIWRGVTDYFDNGDDGDLIASVDDIKDEFINATSQSACYGGGNFGSGYHFSTDKKYAAGFGRSTDDVKGTVFNCALKSNAKIVSHEKAVAEAKKYGMSAVGSSEWALINGYDAVVSEKTGVYNVLNRNALVMEKT